MGKINTITREYMENPIVFADAFNQFLYHGDQKINPIQLTELDTTEIVIPYGGNGAGVPEQKYRDVLKLLYAMTDGRTAYCVVGIENQAEIHYALPVKNGIYDFLQLSHQVSETANAHREVMLYIKYSKDKQTLNKVVMEDIKFQHLERQAAEVINVVTGSKLKYPEGKGDVNMCLAIQQMREESEMKGAVLMCKNLGISLAETIKQIAEMFDLSENESHESVKQYW